jgi:hypothetical protein
MPFLPFYTSPLELLESTDSPGHPGGRGDEHHAAPRHPGHGPRRGGAVHVESSLPIQVLSLKAPGFKVCFQIQLVPLQRGGGDPREEQDPPRGGGLYKLNPVESSSLTAPGFTTLGAYEVLKKLFSKFVFSHSTCTATARW